MCSAVFTLLGHGLNTAGLTLPDDTLASQVQYTHITSLWRFPPLALAHDLKSPSLLSHLRSHFAQAGFFVGRTDFILKTGMSYSRLTLTLLLWLQSEHEHKQTTTPRTDIARKVVTPPYLNRLHEVLITRGFSLLLFLLNNRLQTAPACDQELGDSLPRGYIRPFQMLHLLVESNHLPLEVHLWANSNPSRQGLFSSIKTEHNVSSQIKSKIGSEVPSARRRAYSCWSSS